MRGAVRGRAFPAAVCLGLSLLTLFSFWGTWENGFVYDDQHYLIANRAVRDGLTPSAVLWSFTTFRQANWHPVTWLSHLADVSLFGMNPRGHHLVSLALHLCNVLLLFLVLRSMTGALWSGALAAALFAAHPLRLESVAWISERKDLLAALFGLASAGAWVRYARKPGVGRYAAVSALFALGLMSKPMLVTLPFVFLLLDFWPLGRVASLPGTGRGTSALLVEKTPLLLLSSASAAMTMAAQFRGGALGALEAYPVSTRIGNALLSWTGYLGKALWPANLAVFYPYPARGISWVEAGVAGIFLLAVTAGVVRVARRLPYAAVGWFWYVGMLLPVIGLVQVGEQAMADRYTYLPMIGLAVAIAWGLGDLARRKPRAGAAAVVLVAAALPAMALATHFQVAYWKNDITLFEHALRVSGDNAVALNNVGTRLAEKGRFAEAEERFRKAAALRPDPRVFTNLGRIAAIRGASEEAGKWFAMALEMDPRFTGARMDLAGLLSDEGRFDEAEMIYRAVILADPTDPAGHRELGRTLLRAGRKGEAAAELSEALRLDPGDADARRLLGETARGGGP